MSKQKRPRMLTALMKDGDWIRELFKNDYELLPAASDALELLSACRRYSVPVLLADRNLPLMQGMDLINYIRREHLAGCIVLVSDGEENSLMRDELFSVDGVLIRPLSKSGVLSCVMMAEANCRRNRQIMEEYNQLDQEFRQKRALNYTYTLIQQAYGLTQEQAEKRLLRIAGGVQEEAAELAQKLFEIYLIKDMDNEGNKQKKRISGR